MPPTLDRLYASAQCLIAQINHVFPNEDSCVWTIDVPCSVFPSGSLDRYASNARWKAFLFKTVDPFHELFLRRVSGLPDLRCAFRTAYRLGRQVAKSGPGGKAFATLLRTILNSFWLGYHDQTWDTQPKMFPDDVEVYEPFRFHVHPPSIAVVRQMAVAVLEAQIEPAQSRATNQGESIPMARRGGRPRKKDRDQQWAEAYELFNQLGDWTAAAKEYNRRHQTKYKAATISGWGRDLRKASRSKQRPAA